VFNLVLGEAHMAHNTQILTFFLCGLSILSCSSEPGEDTVGSGGNPGAGGGALSSGGSEASGGALNTGGVFSTGGEGPSGGALSTGGVFSTGGEGPSGGALSAGGSAAGGSSAGGSLGDSGGAPASGGESASGGASGEEQVRVFILFGQSNMWGEPLPQAEDMVENTSIEVLTRISCGNHGVDEWVTALPPLHECVGQTGSGDSGPGVGPGDYFARTLAEAFPNDKILLIPNAIPGVPISEFAVGSSTYNKMIARAEMGQERGSIEGILFHQGESDCGSGSWPQAVKTIVDTMRQTLGTGDIPFLAGEIPRSSQCQGHNTRVAELAGIIENAHVISSEGLGITDQYHFGLQDQRTFGTRYGDKMLELLNP
jgi:hypothetical protein